MIADMAGVSRGTVDRVINNRANVSPELHARIMEVIEKTGYLSPHEHHQKILDYSQSNAIKLGILLPNWTGHFKNEVSRGIAAAESELNELNVEILTAECTTDVPQEAIELIDKLLSEGAQGIALCTQDTPTIKEKVQSMTQNGVPVITFNSDIPNSGRACFIGQNYLQSGRIAAEILSKCVPKSGKILASVGNLEFQGHRERLHGFNERMAELGISEDQITVIQTYNDYQITLQKVNEHLASNPDLQAIYMANRSVGACAEAVNMSGKKGEIRVVCHDLPERTKLLLMDGSVDFTISQDLYSQGYLPLIFLRNILQKNQKIASEGVDTPISIICSQNLTTH